MHSVCHKTIRLNIFLGFQENGSVHDKGNNHAPGTHLSNY